VQAQNGRSSAVVRSYSADGGGLAGSKLLLLSTQASNGFGSNQHEMSRWQRQQDLSAIV
jgi:hypothetical protein